MKPKSPFSKLREAAFKAAPASEARMKEEREESLRDLLRWLLLTPLVILLLFGCGTLGMFGLRPAQADTRSELETDYSPWPFTVFKPVSVEIIEEIQQDAIFYPGTFAEPVEPKIIPADFWFTPTPTPTPVPTPTAAPKSSSRRSIDSSLTCSTVITFSPSSKARSLTGVGLSVRPRPLGRSGWVMTAATSWFCCRLRSVGTAKAPEPKKSSRIMCARLYALNEASSCLMIRRLAMWLASFM